jgi:transposase
LGGERATRVKKKAAAEGWRVLFVDESALYLLPAVTRTWSPLGSTPLLSAPLSRDHLSLIGAVTPEGTLYVQAISGAIDSEVVTLFLDYLQRQLRGKLLIIWDGASIHRSKRLKAYLTEGAARRLHLVRMPAYAPELNPIEGVWHLLKYGRLKNRSCADVTALRQALGEAVQELRARPELIQAYFRQVGY